MKKLFVFLVLTFVGFQAQAELPTTVLTALKKAGIPAQNVAVYVQAVEKNNATLSHNAEKSMNPASVMKLVTTNAALDLLTSAYRWKTEVYRDGDVVNGVLQGNLIIKGYGDPSFKAQDFWRMLMSVQQAGIKEIKGNLIIDKSFFAKNVANKKAFDDEPWRAYNAQPSAFLVNGRNTSFKFIATDTGVKINQEFELNEIQIVNNMQLAQGDCGDWRSHFGYVIKPNSSGAVVTFSGTFSPDCGERYLELSIFDDEKYAFYTFEKLWHELGGGFTGQLKIQELPIASVKVLEQFSDPLGYLVRDVNKWSNNLMARHLLLTLAVEKLGAPASEPKGAAVIETWLTEKGLNFDELVIENGSGLSRIERISAEHLGKMLVGTYNSPVMSEFMASLPILSLDGTIKKRLNDSPTNGRAHLKTGSLDGVSSLAGYVLDAKNHRHVMVMLVNYPKASSSRNAQDALIEWVYQTP